MSPRIERSYLPDGSFIEGFLEKIPADRWRPHGIRYRLAWIHDGRCRVLFDNHHGKADHIHLDDQQFPYEFRSVDQLLKDFRRAVLEAGGELE